MLQEIAYKIQKSKIKTWFSEHETLISIFLLSVFLIALLIISLVQPDNGPDRIKKELEKTGYNVDGIDFVLVDKGNVWSGSRKLYESSKPIEYYGVLVNQWELKSYYYGMTTFYWSVKPYPEIPSVIPVDLQLTITQDIYEQLQNQAGEQEVEEYIKQLIHNSIREAGRNGTQ